VTAPDVDELMERASRLEIIPVGEWADVDQCLPVACEAILRLPRGTLPRIREATRKGWLDQAGLEVVYLDLDDLPPADGQPWIAGVDVGGVPHAVPVVGWTVIRASAAERLATLTRAEVLEAFRVRFAAGVA
jgi:hypothetical protein